MSFAHIVLIPKTGGADTVNKFRPISLCNFSFKVITRIITSPIRGLLENMISPFQSAFVPGRWIAENTILAREVMHKMKSMKGKGGLVGIKIDMSKAYDRIDWRFLLEVLSCFGFSAKVSKIIEQCVCKASSAILLNGCPLKPLRLERGLRQGDPLSPYLFIMVSEVLSCLLAKEEALAHFHGIKIGNRTRVSRISCSPMTRSFLVGPRWERLKRCGVFSRSIKGGPGKR